MDFTLTLAEGTHEIKSYCIEESNGSDSDTALTWRWSRNGDDW
jgi:hypothetical protein